MAISGLLKEIVIEKARKMLNDERWLTYGRQELPQKLGCEWSEKAFLAGAIDAMVFDMAAVLNPRRIPSHEDRAELIKQILDSHGL